MVDSATQVSTAANIPAENTLTVSHMREAPDVARRLALGTTSEGLEKFKALVLRRLCFTEETCDVFREALKKRQGPDFSWKKLELRNIDGDLTSALAICMEVDAVQEIQLVANNTEVKNEGWVAMCMRLQTNSLLQRIRITTTFEGPGIRALSEGLQHTSTLQILDFSWSSFEDDDSVEALTLGLRRNRSLLEVHLMGCSLIDEHVAWLVASLQNHVTLKCLNLSGNKCGPASSFVLAELVCSSNLRKLDVSFQRGSERIDVPMLVEALYQNGTMKTLDLSNCRLGDHDAMLLGQLLCERQCLSELFIARNKITDHGVSALARMLPKSKSLRRLCLWGNTFDDQGAKALADGMSQNFEIVEMDLFRNFFCSDKIILYTHLNRAGRRLLYTERPVPLGLWPLLLARANNMTLRSFETNTADLIFHIIQGPALF